MSSASPAATVTVIFVGTLATAAATQLMGLHLVFGAFLVGIIMPTTWSGEVRDSVARPIEFATKLLLPVYFVVSLLHFRGQDPIREGLHGGTTSSAQSRGC